MVDPTIWVAIITLVGTMVGTCGGIVASSKLTNYRIQELEKKVDKHNNLVEKTYGLEKDQKETREDLDELGAKHERLESKVHEIDTRVTVLERGRS